MNWVVKKKEILPFMTAYMDLEITMLPEISQSEKEKYYMISLYVQSNEQNKLTNKRETEAWIQGTDKQLSEGRKEGGLGERK